MAQPRIASNGRFGSISGSSDPLERFIGFCRFEPETGCVVWTGGTTAGRGHHALYGSFKYLRKRWFAHRWAAKFIHGLEIEGLQVDHCCPHIPHPNTLCVEHLQALTLGENRELQTTRAFEARKAAIQLQVGIVTYEQVYGPIVLPDPDDLIPFYIPPAWLGDYHERRSHPGVAGLALGADNSGCPF